MIARRVHCFALAFALTVGPIGSAMAQETADADAAGEAVSQDGSVVEGGQGGLDIGQGTLWLGLGAALVVGVGLAIAADDSDESGAVGTTGTSGTTGTGGTN